MTLHERLFYLEAALRNTRDNLLNVGAPVFDQFASDVEVIRAEAESIREDAKPKATKRPFLRHKKATLTEP